MNPRTSPIWTISKEELVKVVNKSTSIADVLRNYGYGTTGASHKILKQRLEADNIDISHIKLGSKSNLGRKFLHSLTEEEFVKSYLSTDKQSSNSVIKKYVLLYNLIPYVCCNCGNNGIWNNKKISLQLDHINGINYDNTINNLRFLCPNCHSQTDTFGSKNRRKKIKKIHQCITCKTQIYKNSKSGFCLSCKNKKNGILESKLDRNIIEKLVWEKNLSKIARDLSCSSNGLKQFCIRNNIKLPPKKYLTRRNLGYTHEQALNPEPRNRRIISLNEDQIEEVKRLLDNMSFRAIGRKFGVDHSVISRIKRKMMLNLV